MLMMQRCINNEQREWQYRKEYEQWEQEYQLCWEEMATACNDACAQSQMMNMLFMLMLNRNGGDNSNLPSSPSNIWEKIQCLFCLPRRM